MWTLIAACLLNIALPDVRLRTVEGESATGTLVELDPAHMAIQTAAGRVSWKLEKLAGVSLNDAAPPSVSPAASVVLVDGSTLAIEAMTLENGRARIQLAGGEGIEAASGDICSARFAPGSETAAAQWSKIVAIPTTSDILVVRKDDGIDYHKGVIHRLGDDVVEFELEGERLLVRRSKVFGFVLHHPSGRELPEPIGTLAERSGSTWALKNIELAGDQLIWTTPTGVRLRKPLAAVARLDFSHGNVLYLSDLKPDSVEWIPYFGLGRELSSRAAFYAPREDRNAQSGPLQIDGKCYAKGLSLHARTAIVYRLPQRCRRFMALAGIDDSARPQGNVRLVIRGDDRLLFEAVVTGTDAPKLVDVDMSGVRRLTILVDFGDDFDVGDHLDLCEARLLK